jgi:hypothetical protein
MACSVCLGSAVNGQSAGYDAPGSSPGSPSRGEGMTRRAGLAGVAQSAERRTRNAQVKGSIPFSGSTSVGVKSQLNPLVRCGTGGPGRERGLALAAKID